MDKDQTPQRFPLQRLIRKVVDATGTKAEVCCVFRARGYGPRVAELEDALDSAELVTLPIVELDELSGGTEQWFYDLEAEIPGTLIRFGLHDSTALFVEGDGLLCELVAASFVDHRRAAAR